MAKRLNYDPKAEFPDQEGEEAEKLLLALHTSGMLRALTNLSGRLGPMCDLALDAINSEQGKNAIGVLLAVAQIMTKVPAEGMLNLSNGVERGIRNGRVASEEKPPSTLGLLTLLRDEDTRRALHSILLVLKSVGAAMRPSPAPPKTKLR